MDYNKIRGAAMAYYANLSDEEQCKAWEFFQSIDTNGNGTISRREYGRALAKIGYTDPQNAFKMLDKNGDGVLDFEECITLFYIITVHHGAVSCNGCGIYLWDIYFVCVGCYEAGGNTYDLCCDCYRTKNFEHQNAVFCDNFELLKRMQPTATSASQVQPTATSASQVTTSKKSVSKSVKVKNAMDAVTSFANAADTVSKLANGVDPDCTIM